MIFELITRASEVITDINPRSSDIDSHIGMRIGLMHIGMDIGMGLARAKPFKKPLQINKIGVVTTFSASFHAQLTRCRELLGAEI